MTKLHTSRTCPLPNCSRPELHPGDCGMITSREIKRAVKGSNGSRADRNLWHAINK